jgi:transposase
MKKKHSPAFKFKIALEALKGRPIVDICREYEVAQSLVHKWKTQLQKSGALVFGNLQNPASEGWERERSKLYQHIGELSTQLGFLKKVLGD